MSFIAFLRALTPGKELGIDFRASSTLIKSNPLKSLDISTKSLPIPWTSLTNWFSPSIVKLLKV